MLINNIPYEMRQFKQWVCWKYDTDDKGKLTKLPMSPSYRGQLANVSQSDTWSDFDTACRLYLDNQNTYAGIGFVLAETDPYCFIDLDNAGDDYEILKRQHKVFETFGSYAEISPSGNGLHIICRGKVPSGRKRSKIEIYSSARFMTMTGNIYKEHTHIKDCSELCLTLFGQMGKVSSNAFYDPNAPETITDDEVKSRAANATNSDLFLDLDRGDWQSRYPSQSEADQAYINILAYYTQNRAQIKRMFLASPLGQRDKSKRADYIRWTINKAFDMLLPPVDIEGMAEIAKMLVKDAGLEVKQETNAAVEPEPETSVVSASKISAETFSARGEPIPFHMRNKAPGLVGEIADYIFEQSPRSVPEAALAASFGLMAGMIGRCFNVNGSGLNQYILFLARTGAGKEAISSGIDRILTEVKQQVPSVTEFIGPSQIASGQALIKYMEDRPSFLSIVGEFDNLLKRMVHPQANSAMLLLKEHMLKIYQQSGQGRTTRGMIYSDKDKNVPDILSPAMSVIGECTPGLLFETVDDSLITSGLLPRFTILEYRGKINYINDKAFGLKPPSWLINKISQLAEICLKANQNNSVTDVSFTDDAHDMLQIFSRECTDNINNTTSEVAGNLWNRAHLKTIKLAATIAVGNNPWRPVIDMQAAEYAKELILYDIRNLLKRYEYGEMGVETPETKQVAEIKRAIKHFLVSPFDGAMSGYGVTKKMHDFKNIPHTYFSRRLMQRAAFKQDRMSASIAVTRAVKTMIDDGILQEIDKKQISDVYGKTARMYAIIDPGYVLTFR